MGKWTQDQKDLMNQLRSMDKSKSSIDNVNLDKISRELWLFEEKGSSIKRG